MRIPSLRLLGLASWLILISAAQGATWYVDAGVPGPGDGLSWATAFNNPQDALAVASATDVIRIAQGTYMPDGGYDDGEGHAEGSNDQSATFQLINGVTLEGGYAGVDEANPDLRDINAHLTILSGDLEGDDNPVANPADLLTESSRSDNSIHVVTGSGTDATAVLEGLTITAGRASGAGNAGRGGGMHNHGGSPTIRQCVFVANTAEGAGAAGAALHNRSSSLPNVIDCVFIGNASLETGGAVENRLNSHARYTNCKFLGNYAGTDGGAIRNNNNSAPELTNCIISGNTAGENGGGLNCSNTSSAIVINCTFNQNSADGDGGGMWYDDGALTVTNCIFWGNVDDADGDSGGPYTDRTAQGHTGGAGSAEVTYSCIQDDDPDDESIPYGGESNDNIDDDPQFEDADGADNIVGTLDDDLRPESGASPVIDAGDNDAIPGGTTTDLDGNPRRVDDPGVANTGNGTAPIVDMGAYEQPDCNADGIFDGGDTDGDGVADPCDVCQGDDATGDSDGDGVCDDIDLCNGDDATGDADGDGVCGNLDACQGTDATGDTDSDGVCDDLDICLGDDASGDTDSDGVCDDNDVCLGDDASGDSDTDGVCDDLDVCLGDDATGDTDFDGICDSDDICFGDNATGDTDGDTVCDDRDVCPGLDDRTNCDPPADVICVRAGSPGSNDGSNWYNAYNDLRSALLAATAGDEIWVAAGTYMPDGGYIPVGGFFTAGIGGRGQSFELLDDISIYGGFAGTETELNQRDLFTHKTILSGDINGNNAPGGNSYNVVVGYETDSSAVLNGFTITGGNANGGGSDQSQGGGLHIENSDATIISCTFYDNSTSLTGGGAYIKGGTPSFDHCTFSGNSARDGGGIYVTTSNFRMNNCVFTGNTADSPANSGGGGLNLFNSSPTITNCTFARNELIDLGLGAGIYSELGSPLITNCIFWENSFRGYTGASAQIFTDVAGFEVFFSCIQDDDPNGGGIPYGGAGNGNIDDNPNFIDVFGLDGVIGTEDDNVRLQLETSPCIDSGDNGAILSSINVDRDGNPRKSEALLRPDSGNGSAPIVDMGAYEHRDCDGNLIDDLLQPDSDGDGVIDVCDLCDGDDATGDPDNDGVCSDLDPCPLDNPNDSDADGICEGVDACYGDNATGDSDGDGVCDNSDPCPDDNPDDTDNDGVCDGMDSCPNTIPGAPVDSNGCPSPAIPADFDNDGDVDTNDVSAFSSCASGPTIPYSLGCDDKDFDSDFDVDQTDFATFQRCISGENIPGEPTCAD